MDERTVRRYALRLADLGIPVEARRGRHGGYRLLPGYKLPPLMFTDDEAVAVVLGLLVGRAVRRRHRRRALDKVRRVLPLRCATASPRCARPSASPSRRVRPATPDTSVLLAWPPRPATSSGSA